MTSRVEDLMTPDPICLPDDAHVVDAAQAMRDRDVGDVLVTRLGKLAGMVTDRDITIRVVAGHLDPHTTTLAQILSPSPVCVQTYDEPGYALALMSTHALRRLPVCDGERVVGILALSDLPDPTDIGSAVTDIASAPGNR
jgi:CBS domain-containing protein